MQIELPELTASATLILDRDDRLTDDEYFAFCVANPDLNVERTAEGDIVIVPPPGGESDFRNVSVTTSLTLWARMDGRGVGEFGARLVADSESIAGEGPVDGFVLQLEEIWEGL
jgi:Uma2 family endonuclease